MTATHLTFGTIAALASGTLLFLYLKFKRTGIGMSFGEFALRMLKGNGYHSLSNPRLDRLLSGAGAAIPVIDLSVRSRHGRPSIPGSIPLHFDDFIRDVVVHGKYDPEKDIVLVCDTGPITRVAASVLVEDQGFKRVHILDGGMEGRMKWLARKNLGCCPKPVCC